MAPANNNPRTSRAIRKAPSSKSRSTPTATLARSLKNCSSIAIGSSPRKVRHRKTSSKATRAIKAIKISRSPATRVASSKAAGSRLRRTAINPAATIASRHKSATSKPRATRAARVRTTPVSSRNRPRATRPARATSRTIRVATARKRAADRNKAAANNGSTTRTTRPPHRAVKLPTMAKAPTARRPARCKARRAAIRPTPCPRKATSPRAKADGPSSIPRRT